MSFLRKHWYDIGGFLFILVIAGITNYRSCLTDYQLLMWLSLASLFLHQLEEYRLTGTFSGMLNACVYKSNLPDRFPLNTNTAFYINVAGGWAAYLMAAVLSEKAVWLGLATMLISIGNIGAHTVFFNIKGRTFYNAGLATSWLFFAPCAYFFFAIGYSGNLIMPADYLIGIPLGIALNVVVILKGIHWMADRSTPYAFEERNLLPGNRKAAP